MRTCTSYCWSLSQRQWQRAAGAALGAAVHASVARRGAGRQRERARVGRLRLPRAAQGEAAENRVSHARHDKGEITAFITIMIVIITIARS